MTAIAREELATRYRAWSDEDLLRAATIEPHEYTAEALELINSELARRNCSVPQRQELLEAVTKAADEEAGSLTGVRGSLALMIVVIAFNSIAVLVRAGSYVFQGGSLLAPLLFTIAGACLGVFGLVVSAFLIGRNPRAPRHAATWFLLTMTFSVAVFFYSYLYTGQTGAYPLGTLAVCAVWLAYLSTSKRVKATYKQAVRRI
ncbi:MAG: hypothetical protein ABUT39_24565 [Acidobacteriota bacterium]